MPEQQTLEILRAVQEQTSSLEAIKNAIIDQGSLKTSLIYHGIDFFVIALADLTAAYLIYLGIEHKLAKRTEKQKEKHVSTRLRSISEAAKSWVITQGLREGQRKKEHRGPMYALDMLLNESSAWGFEDAKSLYEQANHLFVAVTDWNQFCDTSGWNAAAADTKINEILTQAEALCKLLEK